MLDGLFAGSSLENGKTKITHNELLLLVSDSFEKPLKKALSAVVELHKPDIYETCVECTSGISPSIAYPCPTIQAIEKELSV